MKLRNLYTGKVVVFGEGIVDLNRIGCKNVGEMMQAGWVDYDDSFWFVNDMGGVEKFPPNLLDREAMVESHKKIGNYFETKRDAEEALEKLKAWQRLKDNGVEFKGWVRDKDYCGDYIIRVKMTDETTCDDEDLDLIFGGRE